MFANSRYLRVWWGALLSGLLTAALPAHEIATLSTSYTKPDPSASGGIVGRAGMSHRPLIGVFAVPRGELSRIYRGTIEDGRIFRFEGLPVGRYDLAFLYPDALYEGFELAREDTLTPRDREQIETHIRSGNPFFETKHMHRIEGTAGTGNYAWALFQEMHVRNEGEIRSFKMMVLMRVGEVGWQATGSREIVRTHRAAPGYTIADLRLEREMPDRIMRGSGLLNHHHRPSLGGIRVVDSVRDIGTIR